MDKKYVDSNVFIQGILRKDGKYKDVFLRIAKKEFIGVTSVLSWDEIVFITEKFLGKETAKREGDKFFKLPNLDFIDVKKETILKAQKLVEKYNLKPRDAIHSATAIRLGIKEIISEDTDFDNIEELKRKNPQIYKIEDK